MIIVQIIMMVLAIIGVGIALLGFVVNARMNHDPGMLVTGFAVLINLFMLLYWIGELNV